MSVVPGYTADPPAVAVTADSDEMAHTTGETHLVSGKVRVFVAVTTPDGVEAEEPCLYPVTECEMDFTHDDIVTRAFVDRIAVWLSPHLADDAYYTQCVVLRCGWSWTFKSTDPSLAGIIIIHLRDAGHPAAWAPMFLTDDKMAALEEIIPELALVIRRSDVPDPAQDKGYGGLCAVM
jgi:hypothetical protein